LLNYIQFDKEELEVDCTDGKSLARAMESLNRLAQELGVAPLEAFMGQAMDDIAAMLGEEIEREGGRDGAAQWFAPEQGINSLAALIQAIKADPKRVKSAKSVIDDLESYSDALETAQKAGADGI
jgi:hypothetical protein